MADVERIDPGHGRRGGSAHPSAEKHTKSFCIGGRESLKSLLVAVFESDDNHTREGRIEIGLPLLQFVLIIR